MLNALARLLGQPTTAAAQAEKPVFLSRAQREAMTRDEDQEKEEITQLMDEAEKEQRHAYMQKVRESIQESRNKRPASRVKRHQGSARVRHPRPPGRSWWLQAARHSHSTRGTQPLLLKATRLWCWEPSPLAAHCLWWGEEGAA